MAQNNWTREQTIVAFNLFCKIPFSKVTSDNPLIIELANLIGRNPNSVKMKIANLGSFDPELKRKGIRGLTNASKLDKEIWDEFYNNWDQLAYESELLLSNYRNKSIEESLKDDDSFYIPEGKDKESMVKVRVNQVFFRQTILSAYNSTCCITGINIPALLIASHIIPWADNKTNRLNPHNGLCLNPIHDKAFDGGFISVTPDFEIKVSKYIGEFETNYYIKELFIKNHDKKIILPSRFIPEKEFLDYHYRNIFIK